MPTTSWVDFTAEVREIPNRTNSSGTGVDDLPLREDALVNVLLTEGVVSPAAAFEPAKGTGDFDVDFGSGSSGADIFVVESDVTGQQPYIVTLEQTSATVTLDAADADPRIDEVYLVVRDDGVDSNADGHRLPRLGYRKGDSATSDPSAPGADANWENYALLATISVSGGATSITSSDITDERATSQLLQSVFDESVKQTAASVFGSVLDSRYAELSGDTLTGDYKWTSGTPIVERTDGSGNTWEIVIGQMANANEPTFRVRKNGTSVALFRWDDPNGFWEFDSPLSLNNDKVVSVGDPTSAQDVATKNYVDTNFAERDSGSYTGDGTSSRTISVGFTPTYVAVTADSAPSTGNAESGFTTSTSRGTILDDGQDVGMASTFKLVSGGFQVDGALNLNEDTVSYSYVALR